MPALKSVLLDTNVIIDVLLAREPFAADSDAVVLQVSDGLLKGYLCANSPTTIDYLLKAAVGSVAARSHIKRLLAVFEIAPVNRSVLLAAAAMPLRDFEDAVIAAAAQAAGVGSLITRNARDFKGCGLVLFSPTEWLAAVG